jgi:UPF0755 protein
MSKIKLILAGAVILFLATGLAAWQYMADYAASPADPEAESQVVLVPAGSGVNALSGTLTRRGIIDNALKFRLLFFLKNRHARIKTGEYRLSAAMSPLEIIGILVRGDVLLHKLTVPEGLNIKQIARLVDQSGLAGGDAFLRAATDPDFVAALGIKADTAEGYLFPETYFFPSSVSAETIIKAMTDRFQTVFTQEWRRRAQELGFSVHEIVTLASIIEKETAIPEERPLIASVFHNRLSRDMRLESDPTVIYGIADFDGNLTRAHLNTMTPYNTYRIKGLPPGPIANPGRASLAAALYPADTAYLYFVATGKGSHYFSTRFADHNRAVRKYQLHR